MKTPLEVLDREIALYVYLVDAIRARGGDTIDHDGHLQLLYVQRAAMVGSTPEEQADIAAFVAAQPVPVLDIEQAVIAELDSHAVPIRLPVGWPGREEADSALRRRVYLVKDRRPWYRKLFRTGS